MDFDAVVLGGGPAGAAAALVLARAGWRVAVAERTRYDGARVGESAPPDVRGPLVALGVWARFAADGHRPSPGIVCCWGDATPHESDFVFNPFGPGWHVDRRRFDAMLAAEAAGAGARVFPATAARACHRVGTGGWLVDVAGPAGRLRWVTRVVIDACGRAARPGTGQRVRYDQLIADVAFLPPRPGRRAPDARILVEAAPDGWWYTAPLPQGTLVAAWLTDRDLAPRGRTATMRAFWTRLAEAPETRRRLDAFVPGGRVQRVAADTYTALETHPDRVPVGDAAVAYDPLSGQGLVKALDTGRRAADALLARDPGAVEGYVAHVRAEFDQYLVRRRRAYGLEHRWPRHPFWQRRHAARHDAHPHP